MISRQPVVNSLGISIGAFQLHCSLDQEDLKIRVSCPLNDQLKTKLALNKMIADEENLNFWISAVSIENCCPWKMEKSQQVSEKPTQKFMLQKISEMQANFHTLQNLLSHQREPQVLPKGRMAQENLPLEALLTKDEKEITKLESLNNILQEKLVEKEGHIVALEKKLGDQDQLVHQLAEKLMLANSDKDDIYNQYEKILQSTVYRSKETEDLGKSKRVQVVVSPEDITKPSFQPAVQEEKKETDEQLQKSQIPQKRCDSPKPQSDSQKQKEEED